MKKIPIIIGLLFCGTLCAQQNVELVTADNKTPGSLIYSLPKTGLKIQVEVKKTIEKAGPYATQANAQFGLEADEVIFKDNIKYEITDITIYTQGFADLSRSYKITAAPNSKANLIQLNENGVISAVNAPLANISKGKITTPKSDETPVLAFDKRNLPEEFFCSGFEEQINMAVEQIYALRETQMDLLSGFVDNIPADAPTFQLMMDELKRKENSIMELFKGKTATVTEYQTFELLPLTKTKGDVLFYFSPSSGFVSETTKNAESYSISLLPTGKTIPAQLAPTKANIKNGFYYCVPENIEVKIYNNNKTLFLQNIQMAQFGTTSSLPANFVEKNNASILFDPVIGTIQIISFQ